MYGRAVLLLTKSQIYMWYTVAGTRRVRMVVTRDPKGRIDDRAYFTTNAEVRYFDHQFAILMDALKNRGVLDNCIIAFTSDHGEEFHDYGLADHGAHLYDETVRVLLFLTGFGRARLAPRLVSRATEIRHHYSTLLRIAGHQVEERPQTSIDMLTEPTPDSVYGHTCHGRESGIDGWCEKCSLLRNGWKLIHTPASDRFELYQLDTDADEQANRVLDEPHIAAALKKQLEAWRQQVIAGRDIAQVETDREAIRMMEEPGYLER